MTREQRLRERETAKILKEEELRKLQENEQKLASNNARLSERHLKAMMKQHAEDLKRLNEEEDWFFDCEKCGTYGSNLVSLQCCCPSNADIRRTTSRPKYLVKDAASGSMSSATAFPRKRLKIPNLCLCALPANERKKMQINRSSSRLSYDLPRIHQHRKRTEMAPQPSHAV
jgi:hypothetical protein